MNEISSLTALNNLIMDLGKKDELKDFYNLQHFYFGCCSWLRGFIEWPKVKELYAKAKLGLGYRSMFMKSAGWRDFRVYKPEERNKSIQFFVHHLLSDLIEWQSLEQLQSAAFMMNRRIFKTIPRTQLTGIWQDTVLTDPKPKVYVLPLRRMAWEIRETEKYKELGVLGDLCEDMGFIEEADHFHGTDCVHTYACRYLHNMAKGMDGR